MAITDDTTKKVLLLIKGPGGRVKISGFYRVEGTDGTIYMKPFNTYSWDICGSEFDSVEYINSYPPIRDSRAGLMGINYLEYTSR